MKKLSTYLPKQLENNFLIHKLSQYVEQSLVSFSSILYLSKGKSFLINKNEQTPYIQLDWRCYSMMRVWANTLITTGTILRHEKTTFSQKGTFGDEIVEKLYTSIREDQKQNVVVLSEVMSIQEQRNFINEDHYQILSLASLLESEKLDLQILIQNILKKGMSPVLLQCGVSILNKYILNKQKNPILDLVLLCQYEGWLPEECIGNEFEIDLKDYRLLWESEKQNIEVKEKIGTLNFKAYGRKDKDFDDL